MASRLLVFSGTSREAYVAARLAIWRSFRVRACGEFHRTIDLMNQLTCKRVERCDRQPRRQDRTRRDDRGRRPKSGRCPSYREGSRQAAPAARAPRSRAHWARRYWHSTTIAPPLAVRPCLKTMLIWRVGSEFRGIAPPRARAIRQLRSRALITALVSSEAFLRPWPPAAQSLMARAIPGAPAEDYPIPECWHAAELPTSERSRSGGKPVRQGSEHSLHPHHIP